jgi:hypothetical protein
MTNLPTIEEFMIDDSLQNMCYPSSIQTLLAQDADEYYIWELSPLFGRIDSEPILVNGPLGPVFYISRLRNSRGSRMCGHQIGMVIGGDSLNKRPLAVYELISENNDSWDILYFDLNWDSKILFQLPLGYSFDEIPGLPSASILFLGQFPNSLYDAVISTMETYTPYSIADPCLCKLSAPGFRPDPHAERMERLVVDKVAQPF